MAVTVEYQSWTSLDYDWNDTSTSTSAPVQINNKLSSWVTAVNSNASNTNRQLTLQKGPSDSTTTNYVGWVVELGSSTSSAAPFFIRFYSSSTSNAVFTASASWTNNTTNGGYGAAADDSASDTSISFALSGVTAEFSVAQETADGVEFFCLGWRLNNSNTQSDQLLIFKDNNGEWAVVFSDGSALSGSYYMPTFGGTTSRNFAVTQNIVGNNNTTGYLSQLSLDNGATTYTPAAGEEFTTSVSAASSALYSTKISSDFGYGRWASVSGSRTAVCMGYGPIWVVY